MWTSITTLSAIKHGLGIIDRLQSEAKTAAKPIEVGIICREGCVELTLKRLDKSYTVEKTNQLDVDLTDFLDYT